jgi:hypothetical protein
LAFYEKGEEEPVLMIQAAKNELELFSSDHLKAWMQYVGIMELPASNGDFEIQLFNGTHRSGRDSVMLITAEPKMPDIRAKIVSTDKGDYKIKLEIKFLKQCSNAPIRTPDQITSFPATGWHEIKAGQEWKIDFGMDVASQRPTIRGGIAYLITEAPDKSRDTLRFFIKGKNPTVRQVNTFLNGAPYNTIWFLKKIIFHESGSSTGLNEEAKQFNSFDRGHENLSEDNWDAFSRMPNMGAPCGWGLEQLDNPQPIAQTLWDWQANIIAAYNLLNGEKRGSIKTLLDACDKIVCGWNRPGRPIDIKSDTIDGGIIYTHASSPDFNHAINTHLGTQPTDNRRSFIDACWMKLYNGRGHHHYYWLEPSKTIESV